MCDFFIIPIHKANKILFIKGTDINARPIIEAIYKFCVFYNQHPFGSTIFYNLQASFGLLGKIHSAHTC